jgi:hypothetical protein
MGDQYIKLLLKSYFLLKMNFYKLGQLDQYIGINEINISTNEKLPN